MAKVSPTSIKYNIIARFEAEGFFQKPDVIGALFGQTEGLLGSDMELRELQKDGKIGRIEVEIENVDGRSIGEIIIPSALDKTETSLIAAAIETIDKIGPTDAKITIKEIEDVRKNKRDYILERAKQLLSSIKTEDIDSVEIENEMRNSEKTSKVILYGEEGLAAGPDVDKSKEIIVVEGRADVVNMLRHGFKNVIGMNGTKLPSTITKLGQEKEITLFVDGDRGGFLIAKNVCDNSSVAYIAQAPDGKEVEELTGKEIHLCLRKKVPVSSFFKKYGQSEISKAENDDNNFEDVKISQSEIEYLTKVSQDIKGNDIAILDRDFNIIKNITPSALSRAKINDAYVVVTNKATPSIVNSAERIGAKILAAKSFLKIENPKIKLISI